MTHLEEAVATSLRLYQVNYEIGLPLFVAARNSDEAVSYAEAFHQNGLDRSPALIADVTEEFSTSSAKAHNHTSKLLSDGQGGVVEYDDEEGWCFVV